MDESTATGCSTASTHQLPQASHMATRLNRTPFSEIGSLRSPPMTATQRQGPTERWAHIAPLGYAHLSYTRRTQGSSVTAAETVWRVWVFCAWDSLCAPAAVALHFFIFD